MTEDKKIYTVAYNRQLAPKTWEMKLEGYTGDITAPGQFVNLSVEGKYLRRPISLCDYSDGEIILLYDVVGDGTRIMSEWRTGDKVDMLTGLGNGFNTDVACSRPLLIGGGIGVAPLLRLGKELKEKGRTPVAVLGFNTAADIVLADEFRSAGIDVIVSTADGSAGVKGFVTDAIAQSNIDYDYYYTCGPMPMLRAVWASLPTDGELSVDVRMACGFGVCMCCSLETRDGAKRVCKDGPVFGKEELLWK